MALLERSVWFQQLLSPYSTGKFTPRIQWQYEWKSLGRSFHCIPEGSLVEIHSTVDTFVFVTQVCIYIGVSL